jgi:hypothetical protein
VILGVVWILCAWAVLGNLVRLGLAIGGVADPARSRIVAAAVVVVSLVLTVWGHVEAMRVPHVRRVDVTIPRLGAGLDGVTVVLLTDTHFGPIDRVRWSTRVVDAVNALDADIERGNLDPLPERLAASGEPVGVGLPGPAPGPGRAVAPSRVRAGHESDRPYRSTPAGHAGARRRDATDARVAGCDHTTHRTTRWRRRRLDRHRQQIRASDDLDHVQAG